MNFFERQRQVRRVSARLVALFVIAVIGIVLVVDLVVAFAFRAFEGDPASLIALLIATSLTTAIVIALASLVRTATLRGGGAKVAQELGGQRVPPDTTDPQLRRLRNVIEEMAIAAGVAVPEIYVLPHESGINAFAAGWSPADAAIAVTRGALERLNRDELQGVIAHEFSHVVNGDMRLNIRLIGLLFGILFLSVVGRTLLQGSLLAGGRGRDGDRSGNNPLPLIGIGLLAAGGIGVLVGRMIQASVSRQREYLADTSAVQFTRQTSGIAGALKKIGGLSDGSRMRSPKRDEVGHMLFGTGGRAAAIFATHPPLADRIKVLDPSFDPTEFDRLHQRWAAAPPSGMAEDRAMGLAGAEAGAGARAAPDLPIAGQRSQLPDAARAVPIDVDTVIGLVSALPDSAHGRAGAIIGQIPDDILVRARDSAHVVPLVFGLLLAEAGAGRDPQLRILTEQYGADIARSADTEANHLAGLHPLLRLPLAQLAFPALRERDESQRQRVLVAISGLIYSDDHITIGEYCLARLVYAELYETAHPDSARHGRGQSLTVCRDSVAALIAVLAQAGNPDPTIARGAFADGMERVLPGLAVPFDPPDPYVPALEQAWPALDRLKPEEKQRLITGVVAVIGYDGVVTVSEAELLRTVCSLLHCALPLTAVAAP